MLHVTPTVLSRLYTGVVTSSTQATVIGHGFDVSGTVLNFDWHLRLAAHRTTNERKMMRVRDFKVFRRARSVAVGMTFATATLVLGSACSSTAQPGVLADLHALREQCKGAQQSALIASDESTTSRGSTSRAIRQQVIHGGITRTAVCGGVFRLTVFSGSQVGQTVFDGDLRADGATEVARLRKVPKIVDDSIEAIDKALPAALATLPGDGTDTTAQYHAAAEFFAQAKPAAGATSMTFTVLTDGISTVPTGLTDHGLTTTEATRLARTVTPALLPGVHIRIIGVGRTSDDGQLPSTYVDALKAFQTEVCQASRAASCLIVTDPESRGAK
ncbi:hypothetical protein QSJ19_02895 [Gordonia sp. ABSL11-1]|uniref:hypothetical protein n=1 Tax=Gordonia sp. ABSL11-1 TaxID=3053924 RepID=UPI00257318EB|nr:hypothetical protein [Gordonia sp. ABSL11-1]MDL9944548.1 hypothetical protein [Gordonia sp. ABSL11-1]